MTRKGRAKLYLHEFPLLLGQLDRLTNLVRDRDPNYACIALFGSVARLEPHADSDTDLLMLFDDPAAFYEGRPVPGVRLLTLAYQAPPDQMCRWSFSGVAGDTRASDLDEDFLAEVARDGVLLYLRDGAELPPVLAGLRSHARTYASWRQRVDGLLRECAAEPDGGRSWRDTVGQPSSATSS